MNREKIEKAIRKLKPHLEDDCQDRYELGKEVGFTRGFISGVNWRINSVWHDVSKELPDIGKHVVNEDWFDFIADDEKDMERILRLYPFKHWAYIDDLLPDGKEDR